MLTDVFDYPNFLPSSTCPSIALLHIERVASLALLSSNAGGWLYSNIPTLELAHAAIDIMRSGFNVDVAADVSLRLHFTHRYLAEMVFDEESGTKRLRRDEYHKRYRDGILRDGKRDADGHTFWGHLAAVRGHCLTREDAERLRRAPFEIVVMYGEEDRVVAPQASKDLARRVGATEVALPGAHFIVDESAHEINRQLAALWKTCTVQVCEPSTNPFIDSYIVRSFKRWSLSPA